MRVAFCLTYIILLLCPESVFANCEKLWASMVLPNSNLLPDVSMQNLLPNHVMEGVLPGFAAPTSMRFSPKWKQNFIEAMDESTSRIQVEWPVVNGKARNDGVILENKTLSKLLQNSVLPDLENYGKKLEIEINKIIGPMEKVRLARIELRAIKDNKHSMDAGDVFLMHQDDADRNGYIHAVVTVRGNGTLVSPMASVGAPVNQYNMRHASLPVVRIDEGTPLILSTLGRKILGIISPWHTSPPVDMGESRIVALFQFLAD